MKTMKKFLSMAALAMVGAMTVGCTNEDNVIDQAQTATKNNVVTQTVTVGFDEQAATRALAIDYTHKKLTKTFKAGDQIAVIYQNSDGLVKETVTIAAGDISTNGKSAKFTVTMTNPTASGTLKYIYPAAMAGATDVDYSKLNSQDGTLTSLASNLDLAVFDGNLTAASELPASASLTNKLAILALKIKKSADESDITSTITGMTLSDGTNSYSITGKDGDGHIYAAIQATSGANISCFATTSSGNYAKSLTSKTYDANTIYDLGLKMDDATTVSLPNANTDQTIENGSTLSDFLGSNVKISIADGAIVTLKDATINQGGNYKSGDYAGITCVGDATIILEGDNTVYGFNDSYPGIYVPEGKTLTIQGTGTLNASSNGLGAGIGGGKGISCGNIVIKGGEITATGGMECAGIGGGKEITCGAIYISGGTVTAKGGDAAAGIGCGAGASCGNITISGGTVKATGGGSAAGIGCGAVAFCGNITISGGTVTAEGGDLGAGIGGGVENNACGTITITSGVTKVEATKGNYAPNNIGKGQNGEEDITVNIDGVANATPSSDFPHFTSEVSGNTWTLTHK